VEAKSLPVSEISAKYKQYGDKIELAVKTNGTTYAVWFSPDNAVTVAVDALQEMVCKKELGFSKTDLILKLANLCI
jgi:cytochrome c-type biogenesis protein CcmH/NrfF